MPVATLLVEGKLDIEILSAVLAGQPLVERRGSKTSLAPQARSRSGDSGTPVAYIRDRDFDYEPPDDLTVPVVDRFRQGNEGEALGWHWCRHEIENYLLEPDIVAAATGCDRDQYIESLVAAARQVRWYEISRWVIGTARRALPPNYDLTTRPADVRDGRVPGDLTKDCVLEWMTTHISEFADRVNRSLRPDAVESQLEQRAEQLSDELLSDSSEILLWCSGKDLMAVLGPWLQNIGIQSPGVFQNRLRDWMTLNTQQVSDLLPEWKRFVELLRTQAVDQSSP